jgi:hypothetical protein
MGSIMKGSEGPRHKTLRSFKTFKSFKRCAPFKPSPRSSPASRGRMKKGLNFLNDWNGLNGSEATNQRS